MKSNLAMPEPFHPAPRGRFPGTETRTAALPDPQAAWQQILRRDPDATFFYAVLTTGIFCRPSCSSRRPLLKNVRLFATWREAQAAGFRPCRRCKPQRAESPDAIALMRQALESALDRPVRLGELGKLAGISPFTAQRLFKQVMGVSPSQYQRALRANRLRARLKEGEDVTAAIYAAGYGSSSRAYEADALGMTPSKFAVGGVGETIGYALAQISLAQAAPGKGTEPWPRAANPCDWLIVARTQRGICWVALGHSSAELQAGLHAEFPLAEIVPNPALADALAAVAARVSGNAARDGSALALDLRGTAFQLKVWQALQEIPVGETRSYSQLAADLGKPRAARAVARACASNRVAVFVPCHRVVGANGALSGYRWGVERKQWLLHTEAQIRDVKGQ